MLSQLQNIHLIFSKVKLSPSLILDDAYSLKELHVI